MPEDEASCSKENLSPTVKPSLRTVSLPQGPVNLETTKMGNTANTSTLSLAQPANAKKKVSQYYKKQNELLENFKNDSEQIEQFNRRQRKRTTSNPDEEANTSSETIPSAPAAFIASAPLVKQTEESDEPEVIVLDVPDRPLLRKGSQQGKDLEERKPRDEDEESRAASRLALVTLFINFCLMIAKIVAAHLSGSMSIISSMVDSIVDITSGLVISVSERMIRKRDPYLYPRGRTRLEPISLILISVIMGMASVQLIISSVKKIHDAFMFDYFAEGEKPTLEISLPSVIIMVATIFIKILLFIVCKKYDDPSIEVLATDHRNDCVSNFVALCCALLATKFSYYFDPVGAIVVSIYILYTWVQTGREHLAKLSGKSAEPEFINRIIKVCIDHDPRISHIDTVYVYHFGSKFLVEVHIVLDENMILRVAHDISETLQSNIESLPEVERAFVHTDYDYDHHPHDEHKPV